MIAKLRQTYYYFGSIVTGAIGILLVFNGISAGTAGHITEILTGFGALLGAGAPALAGKKVGEQLKEGVFETFDPATQVSQGVQAFKEMDQAVRAQAETIKSVLSGAIDDVPVLGPLAKDALDRIKF